MTYEPKRLPGRRTTTSAQVRELEVRLNDMRRSRAAALQENAALRRDAQRWCTLRGELTIALQSMDDDGDGPYRHMLRFTHARGAKLIPGSGNVPVPPVTDALLDAAVDALRDEMSYGEALYTYHLSQTP